MRQPDTHRLSVSASAAAIAGLLAAAGCATLAAGQDGAAQQNARFQVLATQAVAEATVLSAAETTIEPGYSAPSHRHDGSIFAYVLEGEIRSRIDDGPIVLYRAGESWFEAEGVEHSYFENASATEPARFLVVRIGPPRQAAAADQ